MARPTRLELATSCVTGRHSNQAELTPLNACNYTTNGKWSQLLSIKKITFLYILQKIFKKSFKFFYNYYICKIICYYSDGMIRALKGEKHVINNF